MIGPPGKGRDLAKVATLYREKLYASPDPEAMLRRTRENVVALLDEGESRTVMLAVLDLLAVDLDLNRRRDSIRGN